MACVACVDCRFKEGGYETPAAKGRQLASASTTSPICSSVSSPNIGSERRFARRCGSVRGKVPRPSDKTPHRPAEDGSVSGNEFPSLFPARAGCRSDPIAILDLDDVQVIDVSLVVQTTWRRDPRCLSNFAS